MTYFSYHHDMTVTKASRLKGCKTDAVESFIVLEKPNDSSIRRQHRIRVLKV